jgi:hypothetical protein
MLQSYGCSLYLGQADSQLDQVRFMCPASSHPLINNNKKWRVQQLSAQLSVIPQHTRMYGLIHYTRLTLDAAKAYSAGKRKVHGID